jgi:hypothetical protein
MLWQSRKKDSGQFDLNCAVFKTECDPEPPGQVRERDQMRGLPMNAL